MRQIHNVVDLGLYIYRAILHLKLKIHIENYLEYSIVYSALTY